MYIFTVDRVINTLTQVKCRLKTRFPRVAVPFHAVLPAGCI